MKKSIPTLSIILLMLFLLKGYLIRGLIGCLEIGQSFGIKISNNNLISKIDSAAGDEEIDILKILQIAYDSERSLIN